MCTKGVSVFQPDHTVIQDVSAFQLDHIFGCDPLPEQPGAGLKLLYKYEIKKTVVGLRKCSVGSMHTVCT